MIRITIDVFSGRPNPVVELEDKPSRDLLERLRPVRRIDEEAGRLPPSTLGYRGIVIEQVDAAVEELPRTFRLVGSEVFGLGLAHRVADGEVEDFLLGPDGPFARVELPEDFSSRVYELKENYLKWRLEWPWDLLFPWPFPKKCPCGPLYEPDWWNVPSRQPFNNCYNYATNYRSDTYAQPGKAAGAQYASLTCGSVRPAALADELIDAPNAENQCPEEGHLVALVVAPAWDFHWYRKDRNGWWSHKPGGTPVTNLDNSGKKILDPRDADRGAYTDFCTFMVVMHGHIKIE